MFGRTTETAIAALGSLAETHDTPGRRSVDQIAAACGLRPPFLAKLLAVLARSGLVHGERGPGGGYRLARPPEQIALLEVYRLFEGELPGNDCAWGGDCEAGEPCALHDGVAEVRDTTRRFLETTTLASFRRQQKRTARNGRRGPGAKAGGSPGMLSKRKAGRKK